MEEKSTLILAVTGIMAFGIGMRMYMGSLNHARIREAIHQLGGKTLSIKWAPFGPEWWWTKEAIYLVRFRAVDGVEHEVHARTGLTRVWLSALGLIDTDSVKFM